MISLCVLSDEVHAGQRRASGRQIRQRTVIGVDKFNIVLATITDDNPPIGKSFFGCFSHLQKRWVREDDGDAEHCRKEIVSALAKTLNIDDLSINLKVLDTKYGCSKRDYSGALVLYKTLQNNGFNETVDSAESEEAEIESEEAIPA